MAIEAVKVERDEHGFWTHPQFPDWDEGTTRSEIDAWFKENGMTHCIGMMEDEVDADSDPYYSGDTGSFLHWEPEQPEGEGWFILSIHDTDDGPVCVWVRRVTN